VTDTATERLGHLRDSIDNVDGALVSLLAERFKLTQAVGELKAATGMPASDPGREARQIQRLRGLAHDSGLDPVIAEQVLALIIEHVIRNHETIKRRSLESDGVAAGDTA
jgi:chorismate mutase